MARAANAALIHIGFFKRLMTFGLIGAAFLLRMWRSLTARERNSTADIVVIDPFGLGDIISHEPLVRSLRTCGLRVALCARPEWRVLFPEVPWVDANIPWGRHFPEQKYLLGAYMDPAFRDFMRRLRVACAGTIGIDTRGDVRSVILLYLAGCRRVVTLANYMGSDLRLSRIAAAIVPYSPELRRWELNLGFARRLGYQIGETQPPSFPHLCRPAQGNRCGIGIVPVAPWAGKLWQPQKWQALIAELSRRGFEVTALCGPGQLAATQQQIGANFPCIESASIEDLARNLQRFRVIVTLDTGPMHFADALGVPLVALFGQGLLPLWAPSGARSIIVSHQHDPDFRVAAPSEENTAFGEEAMSRIQVPEVLRALEQVLAAKDTIPAARTPSTK